MSGMVLSHYRDALPGFEVFVLDLTHRVFGITLMVVPYLYLMLDRKHLLRWLKKVFLWRRIDWLWIRKLSCHFKEPRNNPMPYTGEFNPGQKAWYVFITLMIPLMSVTGLLLLLGFSSAHTSFYANIKLLHMAVALVTDILLLVHIYLKYLRNWGVKIYAIFKSYKYKKHLNYYLP
jgi:cytochrome b subunit of formate dehydrogenase